MHPETHTSPERNKINKTPKANGSERPRKFVLWSFAAARAPATCLLLGAWKKAKEKYS